MTMLRPATSGLFNAVSSISVKTALAAVIGVTAWHYADSGKIEAHSQQIAEHSKRLDIQADAINAKVDRGTYQADQKELHDDLRELRLGQERTIQLITERLH